jgi:glutamate-1-semialdehyde 2,1-aminomutase
MHNKTINCFERSDQYRENVHRFIPGGAHTYSKGDDQFPRLAPAAIVRGKGGRVWDLDGNEYVDCGMGLGAVSLGHAYEPVLEAVREQLELGAAFSRPAALELDLARDLLAIISSAERVKFAKNGSAVTTAAIKLARAYTERNLIAFPNNQPFFSYDDWFIGLTPCNGGVPDEVKSLSLHYDSTQPETLKELFDRYPGQIACVITEPQDVIPRTIDILRQIGDIARTGGALFILDEMVTGFRAGLPGIGASSGIPSDLSTWGKGIGNGFSFCALTGRADIMDLGGIMQNDAPRVFLISTTHGGEAHTLAAARAVLREYQTHDVIGRHRQLVKMVTEGFRLSLHRHGLGGYIEVHSSGWRVICICRDRDGAVSPTMRMLLLQEMIGRGALFAGYFLPCFAHTDVDIEQVLEAFDQSCMVYQQVLEAGSNNLLVGEAARPVFRKYSNCKEICPGSPCPFEKDCAINALLG